MGYAMRTFHVVICCSFLFSGASFGQTSEAKLAFEAASVKKSADPSARGMMRGGPGSDDPSRIVFHNAPLTLVFTATSGLRRNQISGPDWLDSEPFDIEARIPVGATKEQVGQMMQNLLVDRFKMAVHHETQRFDGYRLEVAKNGPKLKESSPGSAPVAAAPGFPPLSPGQTSGVATRGGEKFQLTARQQSVKVLLDVLQAQLGAQVENGTNLTGQYDYNVEFIPPRRQAQTDQDGFVPDIFTAMEEQLGLKLARANVALDVLVIDRAEKTPIEN